MLQKLIRTSLLALALASVPAGLDAQQRNSTPQRAAAPALSAAQREMQGWYLELQQIGARLQAAQLKAIQDPRLRSMQEALARDFKAAMLRADPGLTGLEARARALEADARKAQQNRDEAAFRRLAEEARQIELRLMNAQKKVMQDAAMRSRMQAFEQAMQRKMVEVEPQTPALIERGKVLQARLMQAAQAQQRR